MNKLIQDVTPRDRLFDAIEEEKAQQEYDIEKVLTSTDSRMIIKELYNREVPFSVIFGVYYELEEAGNGRLMTVEDARLAGHN